ncbi:PCI domain-containing protein 2-like isoform X2 [Artemia franciscana]|uniref:PCI domain-containing protein 2-like isoform X2 n=1 Tax=Artemia franciscana TaxID=6661 RepID=UPI0032DB834F
MESYLNKVGHAWRNFNGQNLASLLSLRDPHAEHHELLRQGWKFAETYLQDEGHLCPLVVYHLRALTFYTEGNHQGLYAAQFGVVKTFRTIFSESTSSSWLLKLMSVVLRDARDVAVLANDRLSRTGEAKPGEILEKCEKELKEVFRVCSGKYSGGEEQNKKQGMLLTVNQMFKLYFRLNNLELCKPVVTAVNIQIDAGIQFEKAHFVTYKYYLGKIAIMNLDIKKAADDLDVAFQNCHKDSPNNKRRILVNLIPLKMLMGKMPSTTLLERYNLRPQFENLASAVKSGHVKAYRDAIKEQEEFFTESKTFLVIEHLIVVVFRNLFKRVHQISGVTQVPISYFEKALVLSGYPTDSFETEGIAASLIYQGKMKVHSE